MDKQEVYHRMLKKYGREGLEDLCFVMDCKIEKVREEMQAMMAPKKERKRAWTPPTLDDVKQYIADNPELASVDAYTFWKGFNDGGWIDTKGNPVRNWKLKLHTWHNHRKQDAPKRQTKAQTVCIKCKKPATAFIEKQCLECYYGR